MSILHRDFLTRSIFAWCEGLIVRDTIIVGRCDRVSGWSGSASVCFSATARSIQKVLARGMSLAVGRRHKRVLSWAITGMLDELGRGTPRRAIDIALSQETSTRRRVSSICARMFRVASISITVDGRMKRSVAMRWMISRSASDWGVSNLLILGGFDVDGFQRVNQSPSRV